MTEKKPGEPDERDRQIAKKLGESLLGQLEEQDALVIAAYREEIESRARREALKLTHAESGVTVDLDALLRETFERGKREGAREALERVTEILKPFDECNCYSGTPPPMPQGHYGDCLSQLIARIRALADQPEAEVCHICGKPATCIGAYEDPEAKDQPACDECCGHGNEDGHCRPIKAPAKADALKRGDEFGWTTISGVAHYGTVTDIDSNVVYVRCRYHGKEECCEATREQLIVQPEAAHGRKLE